MKKAPALIRTRQRRLFTGDTALIITQDAVTDDGTNVPAGTVVQPGSAGTAGGYEYVDVHAITGPLANERLSFSSKPR